MNLKFKERKGITLIALVITVIVLLILAAVSIATLTGENGLLSKTNEAKIANDKAGVKEQAKLDITNWQAERLAKGEDATLTDSIIQSILTGKDYVESAGENSFTTVKGGYEIPYSELYSTAPEGETATPGVIVTGSNKEYTKNGTAIIPVGFAIVPGLDDVSQGLVISDVANDTENTGNQFVWVPVEDIDDFHTIEGYKEGSLDTILSDCTEPYTGGYSTEVSEYNAMKQSVERNHGFYIGRFEAGKDTDGNVVVKKDMPVYNNIKWGNSMTDETGGAVELAKNFATNKGYTSVTSTLCYGVQWDATMQFFDSNYINGTCDRSSYVVDSTGKGNYSGGLIYTGSNDDYAVKNIYDMAGNICEWTMEALDTSNWVSNVNDYYIDGSLYLASTVSSADRRVSRGGFYEAPESSYPASLRDTGCPNEGGSIDGFRVTLYL